MNNFETHINGNTPVVVDFFAEWCSPCKMMPPILKEVKAAVGGQATILKMDVTLWAILRPKESYNFNYRFPNRPHGIQAHAQLFLSKSAKKQSAMGAIIKRRAVCFETDKSDAVRWF